MSKTSSPDQLQSHGGTQLCQEIRKSETSIASARASVMIYDDVNKKWIPSGTSSGLSKVHIFQHNYNNTFRVVGRKLHNHEVVINCIILRSLKYNQATETFHQWRDSKQVYGLNFSSKNDADAFARAMNYAVEILGSNKPNAVAPPVLQNSSSAVTTNNVPNNILNGNIPPANGQQIIQQSNGQFDEDMGYRNYYGSSRLYNVVASPDADHSINDNSDVPFYTRTMTKEDMAVLQERRMSQQTQSLNSPGSVSTGTTTSSGVCPQQQLSSGHQRTSSAPPAPQPPPMMVCSAPSSQPPVPPVPAPPCPPPLPNTLPKSGSNNDTDQSSLAAQLKSAQLRRSNRQSAENSGSSTSSSGSNYGTLGRNQLGMASMMDEMAKTLARRRAAVEKKDPSENLQQEESPGNDKKMWNSKSGSNGCESPKPARKQLTSSEEFISKMNGETNTLSIELENLKQDIVREMKKELARVKQDIIEIIKLELGKR